MNRIWSSLICASLAMMCFAVNSAPVQAQAYVAAAMNGTPGCCGLNNVPVYGPPVGSGYYGSGCCGSAYSGVPIGNGCGCGPSSACCGYGQNNGYRGCGLFGLWHGGCNACGSYRGGSMFPCGAGYPGPSPYGYSGYGYAGYGNAGCGYGGCGFRRCGYRAGCNTGCGCAVPVVTASCCAPVANCCATMSSSAVMPQPVPTTAPATTAPMPTYNTTPTPAAPTPAAPTPAAPTPEAPKPNA